jgi:hypothetical protein
MVGRGKKAGGCTHPIQQLMNFLPPLLIPRSPFFSEGKHPAYYCRFGGPEKCGSMRHWKGEYS